MANIFIYHSNFICQVYDSVGDVAKENKYWSKVDDFLDTLKASELALQTWYSTRYYFVAVTYLGGFPIFKFISLKNCGRLDSITNGVKASHLLSFENASISIHSH